MIRTLSPRLFALALVGCVPLTLSALESFAVGPRALGMGGTGVASVNDIHAQYYNPAAFGFFSYGDADNQRVAVDNQDLWDKDWGFGFNATVGARIHGEFAEYADTLKRIYDDNTIQRIENSQALTTKDARNLADFSHALQNISNPGEAISADLNGGFGLRIQHVGLGARMYSQVSARVKSVDYGLSGGSATQVNNALNNTVAPPAGYANQVLSQAQQDSLAALGISAANIAKLDYISHQAGVTSGQAQDAIDLINSITTSIGVGGGSAIDNNTTFARIYGVGIGEIPVSYGYALNDNISIGGNLKLMIGRVYGADVLIFNSDNEDMLNDVRSQYESSMTWGLDLGFMARTTMFQGGLVARNLNAPKFHGPTVSKILANGSVRTTTYDDYKIDPAVAIGGAFIPWEWLTIAADLDLTTNKTTLDDYATRNVGLGGEVNIFYVLALRAGLIKNLAQDDIGLLYTAGLGLNLWALRIDAAGAMAKNMTTFDGKEFPRELRGSVQISVDF